MLRNSQEKVAEIRMQKEKVRGGRKKDQRFEGTDGAGMVH